MPGAGGARCRGAIAVLRQPRGVVARCGCRASNAANARLRVPVRRRSSTHDSLAAPPVTASAAQAPGNRTAPHARAQCTPPLHNASVTGDDGHHPAASRRDASRRGGRVGGGRLCRGLPSRVTRQGRRGLPTEAASGTRRQTRFAAPKPAGNPPAPPIGAQPAPKPVVNPCPANRSATGTGTEARCQPARSANPDLGDGSELAADC